MTDNLNSPPENRQHSSWGGARPGTGPKPNAVKYKTRIAKATDIMGRMLPEAAQATTDLATGAYVILVYNMRAKKWEKPRTLDIAKDAVESGFFRVYQELPDIRAIQVMFERLMGKVPQPVDVTVRQAVAEVVSAQDTLMRIIEEHVSDEVLTLIRDDLDRVAGHHTNALTAIGVEG